MSTYGPSSSLSRVIFACIAYSALAGTCIPLANSTNFSGFPCNFWCNAAATVNSSRFTVNDMAAANNTTASAPFTTAISTPSPSLAARSVIVLRCLGTNLDTVCFPSLRNCLWNDIFLIPLY